MLNRRSNSYILLSIAITDNNIQMNCSTAVEKCILIYAENLFTHLFWWNWFVGIWSFGFHHRTEKSSQPANRHFILFPHFFCFGLAAEFIDSNSIHVYFSKKRNREKVNRNCFKWIKVAIYTDWILMVNKIVSIKIWTFRLYCSTVVCTVGKKIFTQRTNCEWYW